MASPVCGGFTEADIHRVSAGYPSDWHSGRKGRTDKGIWKGSDADWGTDFRTCRLPQGKP